VRDPRGLFLIAVVFDVALGGFARVAAGLFFVAVGELRMVRGLLVIAGFVVLCCVLVMLGRIAMRISSALMMLCSLLRHFVSPYTSAIESSRYFDFHHVVVGRTFLYSDASNSRGRKQRE
jgi:hypothetical protein